MCRAGRSLGGVFFRPFGVVLACFSWTSVVIWGQKSRLESKWNDAELELELELELE